MFININTLLHNNFTKKTGYDFISITKVITNDNMGKDNAFHDMDIADLKRQKNIQAIGPLISNQFRVKATAGNFIPFSTDLFLETIPKDFMDTLPPSFTWNPGQDVLPIIFSSDFLEMYNVFAPAQGLPQISSKTISAVNIRLECSGNGNNQVFKANIVGLTDRINSILVPENFMLWANQTFNNTKSVNPERIFIKTSDANDPNLLKYLDNKNYHLNKDKTKFGRIKQLLQNIITCLGFFGAIVILLAIMLFSFYLQLLIEKSKQNLSLLVTLGYSPKWIGVNVTRTLIPAFTIVIIVSVIMTTILNYLFIHLSFIDSTNLSLWPSWSVLFIATFLWLLSILSNYNFVRKTLMSIFAFDT